MACIRQSIKATPEQIATWFLYPEQVETLSIPQRAVILRALDVKAKINKHQDKYVVLNQYQSIIGPAVNVLYDIVKKHQRIHYVDLMTQYYDSYPTTNKYSFKQSLGKLKHWNCIRYEPCA